MSDTIALTLFHTNAGGWAIRLFDQLGIEHSDLELAGKDSASMVYVGQQSKLSLNDLRRRFPLLKGLLMTHASLCKLLRVEGVDTRVHYFREGDVDGDLYASQQTVTVPIGLGGVEEVGSHVTENLQRVEKSGILILARQGLLIVSVPWQLDSCPEEDLPTSKYLNFNLPGMTSFSEIGSTVDFGTVRRGLLTALRRLYAGCALPLVRIDFRPSMGPALCVRVDADGYSRRSTEAVIRISQRTGYKFSWFIDGRPWLTHTRDLRTLHCLGHEVGIHCFYHVPFTGRISSLLDGVLARVLLRFAGIEPKGAVAPFGAWSRNYLRTMRILSLSYTSEFGLGGDDLPFHPFNDKSNPLQLPTFNASIGVLPDTHQGEIFAIWRASIERQLKDKGVAVIYDHPLNRMEHLEEGIVDFLTDLSDRGCQSILLRDYAEMWNQRPTLKNVRLVSGSLKYECDGSPLGRNMFPVIEDRDLPVPEVPTNSSLRLMRGGDIEKDAYLEKIRLRPLLFYVAQDFARTLVRPFS